MKWFLYSCFGDTLSKAHFVCLVACRLFRFVKPFVCFCKAENIVIYILIHTIQLIFFSTYEISQVVKIRNLRNFCSVPIFFSL